MGICFPGRAYCKKAINLNRASCAPFGSYLATWNTAGKTMPRDDQDLQVFDQEEWEVVIEIDVRHSTYAQLGNAF